MKNKVFVMMFLLLGSGILFAADQADDFQAAVNAGVKEFTEALAAKDPVRLGAVYAKDAIAYPPNAEMVSGRESIQNLWKGIMDAGLSAKLETLETVSKDGLGFETGKFTILTADGKTADQGKYLVVWKKEDGKWKLYRDMWNSSMPAPQQ